MKTNAKSLTILGLSILLSASLLTVSCNKKKPDPTDTESTAVTRDESDTRDSANEKQTLTQTESENPSDPPSENDTGDNINSLTIAEIRDMLRGAFDADIIATSRSMTIITYFNGEVIQKTSMIDNGHDFHYSSIIGQGTEAITVLNDTVYYYISYDDGSSVEKEAYIVSATSDQLLELHDMYLGEDVESDADFYEALLTSDWSGSRRDDGSVVVTSAILDDELTEEWLGIEDAKAHLEITLSSEGLMTLMNLTVDAEIDMTIESSIDYTFPVITAPTDLSDYTEATFEEVFYGIAPIDPEIAASIGLPLDGNQYVIGAPDSTYDLEAQYDHLYEYAAEYMGKTFILYGYIGTDDLSDGDLIIYFSDYMYFYVSFDSMNAPADGAYVKLTATFDETTEVIEGYEFTYYVMTAVSWEQTNAVMYVDSDVLTVRSTPDAQVQNNVVGYLMGGDRVEILETGYGENGMWYKILYTADGYTGEAYANAQYLSLTPPL